MAIYVLVSCSTIMCGRYLTPDQAALERHFGLMAPDGFSQSFNLAPTQLAPVVRSDEHGAPDLSLLTWGFQPPWAKRAWINARSETVFTSKAFASAARKRRCLIPAMGWYEWQGANAPRQPYVFHTDGFKPFAFAGIWTGRETEEGWIRNFAILTMAATGELAAIHDRKPLVLDRASYEMWIAADTPQATLDEVIAADPVTVSAYRVSDYVNKPANNDAQCIAPLEA